MREGGRLRRNRLDPHARDVVRERRRGPPIMDGVDGAFLNDRHFDVGGVAVGGRTR
jgi:hypothetical protein